MYKNIQGETIAFTYIQVIQNYKYGRNGYN